MQELKASWMEFCGRSECEAWLGHLEDSCVESVTLMTPESMEGFLEYPSVKRVAMDYFAEDFINALSRLSA